MKLLRIIATIVIGGYLLAMGLQLIGVSIAIIREVSGIAPDTANAKTAFFPNLLVCVLGAIALWVIWKKPWGPSPRSRALERSANKA